MMRQLKRIPEMKLDAVKEKPTSDAMTKVDPTDAFGSLATRAAAGRLILVGEPR